MTEPPLPDDVLAAVRRHALVLARRDGVMRARADVSADDVALQFHRLAASRHGRRAVLSPR